MRGRIIELEAMLAAFQQEMEEREANFAQDMNNMYQVIRDMETNGHRYHPQSRKNEPKLERRYSSIL